MQVINLSNHVVRKALCLSLNEMAILCDIVQMSQNPEYGYWCIKSKDKIAEWLDISRGTVFNGINTLITKGYVEKSEMGLRPTKGIYELNTAQEEIGLYIKNNNTELITKKLNECLDSQYKNCTNTVQKLYGDSTKIVLPPYKNCTQDIHLDENKKNTKKNIYAPLLEFLNHTLGKNYKTISEKTEKQINGRLKDGWALDDIRAVIVNASKDEFHKSNNYKYLTLELITRVDKFERYAQNCQKKVNKFEI